MKGSDSYGPVTGAACQQAGVQFACRYLWQVGLGLKGMGGAEYADLRNHDILVVLNFEGGVNDVATGFAGGQAHAKAANAYADAAGCDPLAWIYYSIDESVPESAAVAYFQGLNSVPGRKVAAYGGQAAKQLMLAVMSVGWWQSESRSFSVLWPDPAAHIWQNATSGHVGGTQVDWNVSQADYFGACGQSPSGGFLSDLSTAQQQEMYALITGNVTTAPGGLAWSVNDIENVKLPAIVGQLSALQAAVAKIAATPPGAVVLSPAQVAQIAQMVVAQIAADLNLTKGNPAPTA